jgi:hypothetical protein
VKFAYERSSGEFVLTLDADFAPRPDFIYATLPYFEGRPVPGQHFGVLMPAVPLVYGIDEPLRIEAVWMTRVAGLDDAYGRARRAGQVPAGNSPVGAHELGRTGIPPRPSSWRRAATCQAVGTIPSRDRRRCRKALPFSSISASRPASFDATLVRTSPRRS